MILLALSYALLHAPHIHNVRTCRADINPSFAPRRSALPPSQVLQGNHSPLPPSLRVAPHTHTVPTGRAVGPPCNSRPGPIHFHPLGGGTLRPRPPHSLAPPPLRVALPGPPGPRLPGPARRRDTALGVAGLRQGRTATGQAHGSQPEASALAGSSGPRRGCPRRAPAGRTAAPGACSAAQLRWRGAGQVPVWECSWHGRQARLGLTAVNSG